MKKTKNKKTKQNKKTVPQVTLGALGRPQFIVCPLKIQRLHKLMRRSIGQLKMIGILLKAAHGKSPQKLE